MALTTHHAKIGRSRRTIMQSTVHLFNTALARLGGEQLAGNISPLEQSATGKICENLFPHVLDMTLAAHAWAFAVRRKALASCGGARTDMENSAGTMANPAYPFAFELPTDCVKPLRLEGYAGVNRTPAYVIEGRAIRCSLDHAVLAYVARITEPRLWPPLFADALAWGLAGELAAAINNDARKQQWCRQNYRIAMADAVAVDKRAQNPMPKKSAWTAARFGA
jgi:hypothetical protein